MIKSNDNSDYSPQMINETMGYLKHLKSSNRKLYNKLNKQGRKFSDNIMKQLK